MPSRGGAADKAGDRYEALWAVDAALRVIEGCAESLTYESLVQVESPGVEFNLLTATGDIEFWSVKRQTTAAAGWTLATLVRQDENGRSILGDLAFHVERHKRHLAVFASTLGANKLEELCSVSATAELLRKRLEQSLELKRHYDKYLLPLFDHNTDRVRQCLTRLKICTANESYLRQQIESRITLLFYGDSGSTIDAASIRRRIAEYLSDHIHESVNRPMLLDHLAEQGIRRKDWKIDNTVREKVFALCGVYTKSIREQLIGGILRQLPGISKLLGLDGLPAAQRMLLTGGAGSGKSTVSANVIEQLCSAGIPTLPVRMDTIAESVLTPKNLGIAMSLPASPVAVLAGLADGGDCVLVIDQLDAISMASGRRPEMWTLFEQLLIEVDGFKNMRLIVSCREFDLEHDHRLKSLKSKTPAFEVITIKSFDPKTVDDILGNRQVHSKMKPLLQVPLHLAIFLSLTREASEMLETPDQLFAEFWTEKQRRTSQRLGRTCNFVGVVDRLCQHFSAHQELSAPEFVLDDFRADADSLTSEHVLVLTENRFRFFHETFFDYAFSRRFAQSGQHLTDILLRGEQHLFRRGQVRQVLSFLRSNDPARYISELRSVLANDLVRFHVKRSILSYLNGLVDPMHSEWVVLQDYEATNPGLLGHVNRVIWNHVGWFDVLDAAGFLESGLSSRDSDDVELVIGLSSAPEIMEHRSARVAALLKTHGCNSDQWRQYFQHICRYGQVYHSREMFDLFLDLIRRGILAGAKPGFAINDSWWTGLYEMSERSPSMTAEVIAAWFDQKLQTWLESHPDESGMRHDGHEAGRNREDGATKSTVIKDYLRQHLEADGEGHWVILKGAKSPLAFATHLLPRLAEFVLAHSSSRHDRLNIDPLWSFRWFGDSPHFVHDAILVGLAQALEEMARSLPAELNHLLDPYVDSPHDTIAYLVLRAWSAAPATYGERLAYFLSGDSRRLKIGYACASGRNAGAEMASCYRSIVAVRAASESCSPTAFIALERAILALQDERDSGDRQERRLRQLRLLTAMEQSRLGKAAQTELANLRDKFPGISDEPPRALEFMPIGSPIPEEAQEKMTDDHWLRAMAKYAGIEHRMDRDVATSGGERQLADSLESRAKSDPKRFITLATKMPTSLPAAYFDAIIRGVATTAPQDGVVTVGVTLDDLVALIERAHALPGHPCGRWIAFLVEKWDFMDWPAQVIEIIKWYATKDPDPIEEVWRKCTPKGQHYDGGNPDHSGRNSTRGAAAGGIARILFRNPKRVDVLSSTIDSLAHDRSIAVRSQAVRCLLALLNCRSDLAIKWFVECVSVDTILLRTTVVEHFVRHAGHRDYSAIRPILQKMLASDDEETVDAGARLCCLLALDVDAAKEDAAQVRIGNTLMRKGAASVYAVNIADEDVGEECRKRLSPFFANPDETVRAEAAHGFSRFSELNTSEQGPFLASFLDTARCDAALGTVIRVMEGLPVKLPDLVCRLIEVGIEAFKTDVSDIRSSGARYASDLSKIVIRLYTQSDDDSIKKRCLDAIDRMEWVGYFGLSDELSKIDR